MKETDPARSSYFYKISLSVIYGLAFAVLISYRFFHLTQCPLLTQCALVFGSGLVFGGLVFYLITTLSNRLANIIPRRLLIGLILVTLLASGIVLTRVAYRMMLTPTSHHVEIIYANDNIGILAPKSVQLVQLKLTKTGILPLDQIFSGQTAEKKVQKNKITSIPLPIEYSFTNHDGEMIEFLFLVTPPGDEIIVQFDQDRSYHNFATTQADQIIVSLPVYNRFTPIQLFLFSIGISCFLVVVLFLLHSILHIFKMRIKIDRLSIDINSIPIVGKIIAMVLAAFFAAALALLLSTIATNLLGNDILQGMVKSINFSTNNLELQEKGFYILFYILGFILCVFAGRKWDSTIRHPIIVVIALLALLPVINHTANVAMHPDPQQTTWLLLCVLITVFLTLFVYGTTSLLRWLGGIGFFILWMIYGYQNIFFPIHPYVTLDTKIIKISLFLLSLVILAQILQWSRLSSNKKSIIFTTAGIIILCIMIIPASLTYIAANLGTDIHAPFYLYLPAIFSRFGQDQIPGVEYHALYGVGAPYLFSFLLGDRPQTTEFNYVILVIMIMLIYFGALFLFLRQLLNSDQWALAIVIVSLLLQFWGTRHLYAPSTLVFRYPLFPFILALIVRWGKKNFNYFTGFVLALLLGLSIFWTTETGVSFLLASCITILIILGFSRRSFLLIGLLFLETGLVFLCSSWIELGSRVFSVNYIFNGIISPLIMFSAGRSASLIGWRDGLPYFANFICPIIAVVSLGLITASKDRDKENEISLPERILLVFCSALTILFFAKYLNRSFIQNWHAAVIFAVIIIAYWLKRLANSLSIMCIKMDFNKRYTIINFGQILGVLALVTGFVYVLFIVEVGENPPELGLKSYVTYDSLVNRYLLDIQPENLSVEKVYWTATRIPQSDIDLIQKYSSEKGPVLIIGVDPEKEWEYYLMAKRVPVLSVISTYNIFTRWQKDPIMADMPETFFLLSRDDSAERKYVNIPELDDYIRNVFLPQYTLIDKSESISAYKKR